MSLKMIKRNQPLKKLFDWVIQKKIALILISKKFCHDFNYRIFCLKYPHREFLDWGLTGDAPRDSWGISYHFTLETHKWLNENIGYGNYNFFARRSLAFIDYPLKAERLIIGFKKSKDLVAFKLRWA